ncbi:MAG TPA: toxin TcdB middle/N-terminal domain-containing protein [Thermomicrobiaceae bacterium]|nr:toxin TcdB middle/N-terminal domain-containing protein [Thermomicrobiaceae bacterium]
MPPGGSSTQGIGVTFQPDLATGAAAMTVPLDLPNGPNNIAPQLRLAYSSGAGNGPFGLGWQLPLPALSRDTAHGYPRYDGSDTLLLEGCGELLDLGGGAYRPRVDDGSWRVAGHGEGFLVTDRAGLRYTLGSTVASCTVDDPALVAGQRIFDWRLERIDDALGNAAVFAWTRDARRLYLASVTYGVYQVRFVYEPRPDVIRAGRAGFLVTTGLRCRSIELHLTTDANSLVRRWDLSYTADPANGASLLASVALTGSGADSATLTAPALQFSYAVTQPPALSRFGSRDAGARPGPLRRADRRVELIDWNSDGLPDLLEIAGGGQARVWPNAGNLTWDRPQPAGVIPLFASPQAAVALLDMNGDGLADLVRADVPLGQFIPRASQHGWAQPVAWRRAPAAAPLTTNARLVDLDGDGLVDLLVSRAEQFELHYRRDPEGWLTPPQVVRPPAPVANLADPHVFVAGMKGDGAADLVRVDGGGVAYWPYLGNGVWDTPVAMAAPPHFPYDLRPERLLLADLDGDGCADLLYLGDDGVYLWLNQTGNAWSAATRVAFSLAAQPADLRVAAMRGSGTSGILWSTPGLSSYDPAYFYLEPLGDAWPRLLTGYDNGVGQRIAVAYAGSAMEAAEDTAAGNPWPTPLPVALPVVKRVTTTDVATGVISTSVFHYHDGRFDGALREFAGFGRVERQDLGDDSIPTLSTVTDLHNGVDPANPVEPGTLEERHRLRAIRGRIYRQERYGLDGSPAQPRPYDRTEFAWQVTTENTTAGPVAVPRQQAKTDTLFERAAAPASVVTTTNLTWDGFGNITSNQQTVTTGDPTQTQSLQTAVVYAVDPAGRFVALPWRTTQRDGAGQLLADTIVEYDHAAEGTVDAQGLVTRRSSLALTDAQVTAVYGAASPDFASLGYHRRPDQPGWWIDQATYTRVDDAAGLRGSAQGPLGGAITFVFDDNKTYPVRVGDAYGNTTVTTYDYRACQVSTLTEPSGATRHARYDPLARTVAIVEPGDSDALPTQSFEYHTDRQPVERLLHRRAESEQTGTIDQRDRFDGGQRQIEQRVRDDAGEIVTLAQAYNARGRVARSWLPFRAAAVDYAPPDPAQPHATMSYDALGRLTRQQQADGSARSLTYGPLQVTVADEEDSRTDAGAPHANTPTRHWLTPLGQVEAIEENLGGRWLRSSYTYDIKGKMLSHTDALGNVTRFVYDLLGRTLRVERPERKTTSVLDATNNVVEARVDGGASVFYSFDDNSRLTAVREGSAAAPPTAQLQYQDAGRPAPPDAGAHTQGGRLVRLDDEGGTVTFDYDARGLPATKRYRPAGAGQTYDLDISFRADGQPASITYPDGGGGRYTLRYTYDARGLVTAVSDVVTGIDHDLTGRRTQTRYANGAVETRSYDALTHRLTNLGVQSGGAGLFALAYTFDRVGNVVQIGSADPTRAWTYSYDDLYRLIGATSGDGLARDYRYDDAGNIVHRSDVGDYHYGEGGASPTCLTTAGGQAFTYSPSGDMAQTPWGTQEFNDRGRLTSVTRGADALHFTYTIGGWCAAAARSGSAAWERLTPDPLFSIEQGNLILNLTDGQVLAARRAVDGSLAFVHVDHLGSVLAVTDQAGAVIDTRRYDPYGQPLAVPGAGPTVPIGFAGGITQDWTGLLLYSARYYQPAIGRFVSPDTTVQRPYAPIDWAPFAYCGNNPTSYTDPSGHSFWGDVFGAVGAVAGAVGGFFVAGPAGAVAGAVAGYAAGSALGNAFEGTGVGQAIEGVLTDPRFWESVAAVAALVGLAVLSVVSFGTLTPFLVVGIGVLAGGLIGGMAAAQKGGDFWSVLNGALVGAAVGGWAAFGGMFAGSAAAGAFGLSASTPVGGLISGVVNGTVSGAASGFTTGFAGGQGSLSDIGSKVWQGALVGAVVGGVLGGANLTLALKGDGGGWPDVLGQKLGMSSVATKFGSSISVDVLQSSAQAVASIIATAAKVKDPSDKGWLKFGLGDAEYIVEGFALA